MVKVGIYTNYHRTRVLTGDWKKMILLLGKNYLVEQYANEILKIDMMNDIVYYPGVTDHFSEFDRLLNDIKEDIPPVITSQNIEFINCLLDSDLKFEVFTVYENNIVRKMSKEKAIWAYREEGLELR